MQYAIMSLAHLDIWIVDIRNIDGYKHNLWSLSPRDTGSERIG